MSNRFIPEAYEKELLSQIREDDTRAFEYIYNIYSSRLYGSIYKVVKSTDITEEILQESFQRVWEYRKTIKLDKCFRSYLFTIARNLLYDYFNRTSRQRLTDQYLLARQSESATDSRIQLENKEADLLFEKAIGELPPQRKIVYTLCKIEGRSYEDVSKTLGISVSTISDHIVKATKFIKSYYLSRALLLIISALS